MVMAGVNPKSPKAVSASIMKTTISLPDVQVLSLIAVQKAFTPQWKTLSYIQKKTQAANPPIIAAGRQRFTGGM